MFKMFSCKDMSKIESDERDLSLGSKLNHKIHLFMCENCRKYMEQMQLTRKSFKNLIIEKSKFSREHVLKIEKATIDKFTKK